MMVHLNFLFCVCISSFFIVQCSCFKPLDSFLINCGENDTVNLEDGRVFEPDSWNPNLSLSPNSHIVVSNLEMGVPQIYTSARVFTKDSTFAFGTKQIGRHWLRLHFYPVKNSYHSLNSAVFSVVANGYTLLHGFTFSKLTGNHPAFKEFVIEVGGSSSRKLELTFSPRNSSIAFINGIELVSVPKSQFTSSVIPIPLAPAYEIPPHIAFETVYRVNMGGPLLTPKNDTLWRRWEPDKAFLVNPAAARNFSTNPSLIKYPSGVSAEIAPHWVYATAQEMADANVTDQRFNISWEFKVEQGFSYFIRMHFCDIVSLRLNDLVFNVYLNKQTALDTFEISGKTLGLSAAYFVDFVSDVPMGSHKILVQVGPTYLRSFPSNAILNGLEILKMSNPSNSLDGKFSAKSSFNSNPPMSIKKMMVLILSCLGGFVVIFLISATYFFYFCRPKKPEKQDPSTWLPLPSQMGNSETKISTYSYESTSASLGLGQTLSFSEIREATKNFDEGLLLGAGGFGKVYKGILENGVEVAVKRGNPRSQQGLIEFKTEIKMLTKLRHHHLVSLIGYCDELNEMILVYEYMAGGPLRKHLYGSGSDIVPLTWKQRIEICIGAAKGLHHLHTGASETIIHRDVKTTNILLDDKFDAKVSDFGLSKFGPTLDQTHVSTAVKGSFGYLDPEYFRRQQLTEKSDVYSFGVVLMEVLCARPAINPTLPREQVNVAEWAMTWQKKGQLEKIMDPTLVGTVNRDSLRKFGETAEKCLGEYGSERPSMGDVMWNLEYVLQLQESSTQSDIDENSVTHISDILDWGQHGERGDNDNVDVVSDQESEATAKNEVFYQLMNRKGSDLCNGT